MKENSDVVFNEYVVAQLSKIDGNKYETKLALIDGLKKNLLLRGIEEIEELSMEELITANCYLFGINVKDVMDDEFRNKINVFSVFSKFSIDRKYFREYNFIESKNNRLIVQDFIDFVLDKYSFLEVNYTSASSIAFDMKNKSRAAKGKQTKSQRVLHLKNVGKSFHIDEPVMEGVIFSNFENKEQLIGLLPEECLMTKDVEDKGRLSNIAPFIKKMKISELKFLIENCDFGWKPF